MKFVINIMQFLYRGPLLMYLHHNLSIAPAGVGWPSADAALNTKLPIADPHSATHHRISPASVTLVNGSYFIPGNPFLNVNLFNPQQLTGPFSVPTGYGNQGSYVNVAVDSPSPWVEFGWQLATGGAPLVVVSVDITKVSATGYQVTWTVSLGALGGVVGTPTVTLVSDAFTTCASIMRVSSNYSEPTTGSLSPSTITLTTPDIIGEANTYTATWSIACPMSEVPWWWIVPC
jgi:hypothetical protein